MGGAHRGAVEVGGGGYGGKDKDYTAGVLGMDSSVANGGADD